MDFNDEYTVTVKTKIFYNSDTEVVMSHSLVISPMDHF